MTLPVHSTSYAEILSKYALDPEARRQAISEIVPEVGMGATWHGYSDSHACTVVAVSPNGKVVTVREDRAVLMNGVGTDTPDALHFEPGGFCGHTSGVQRWALHPAEGGSQIRFSKRTRKGKVLWLEVGQRNGRRLTLGARLHHYDFNF